MGTTARRLAFVLACSVLAVSLLAPAFVSPSFAAAPFGRYVLTEETVFDTRTRLVWQRRAVRAAGSWTTALQACENLDLAGAVDWRLPNVREFATLLDHAANPAWDSTAFNNEPGGPYYTSSIVQSSNFNRAIAFDSLARLSANNHGSTLNYRCVRGPAPLPPD